MKNTDDYKNMLLTVYETLESQVVTEPFKKSTEQPWHNIFIGRMMKKIRRLGKIKIDHYADLNISLPFGGNPSQHVKNDIVTFLQHHNNIKENYLLKSGTCTVYKITCCNANCLLSYIGQTDQNMHDRFDQHLKNTKAIRDHERLEGHSFKSTVNAESANGKSVGVTKRNIEALNYRCNEKKRLFLEALYIKDSKRKEHKLLNTKEGDIQLQLF